MTVAALTPRISYLENGATLAFAVPFKYLDPADLIVTRLLLDGTEITLTRDAAWSATPGPTDAGGTLTLVGSVAGATLTVERQTSQAQTADYETNDRFPAKTIEGGLDRLSMVDQDQEAKLARALLVPPGEAGLALDPMGFGDGDILEYRAGKFHRFDPSAFVGKIYGGGADGHFVPVSGTGADAALRADLASAIGMALVGYQSFGPGAAARTARSKLNELSVSLEDYGGGTGVPDNKPAIVLALAALASVGGGVLQLGRGNYNIASASLAAAIAVPANVTIRGHGRHVSTLTVTGGSLTSAIFTATDVSNISIGDLGLIGNGVATGYNNGCAISVKMTSAASAPVHDIAFPRLYVENFRAPWWINVENDFATYELTGVTGEIYFLSKEGNSLDPSNIGANSAVFVCNGFGGIVRDIAVRVVGDATHIKGGIILYNRVVSATINNPIIANAGLVGANDDRGAYAIQIYDPSGIMQGITVNNPIITAPRSCGIYVAQATDVTVNNPQITGQTDVNSATLPKGAIAFNQTLRPLVNGGSLGSNVYDLAIVAPLLGAGDANGRFIGLQTSGSLCAVLLSYSSTAVAQNYEFLGCQLAATTNASYDVVRVKNNGAAHVDNVVFDGGYIRNDGATGRAVNLFGSAGSAVNGTVFKNISIIGQFYAQAVTGTLSFQNASLQGNMTGGAALFTAINCTSLRFRDLNIVSVGSGVAYDTTGSTGVSRLLGGIRTTLNASSMGAAKPTFSGTAGDRVENLTASYYTPQGAAGSQYLVDHWVCAGGTTWNDSRVLTGT